MALFHMFLDNVFEDDEERRRLRLMRRNIRDHYNPFELPENQFRYNFRLSKDAAMYVINALNVHLQRVRISKISNMITVLCALQFFANGSYQRVVGNNILTPVCQTTTCRSIKKIYELINNVLAPIWIRFPRNEVERTAAKNGFRRLGMENIIALVDGTHVAIVKPHLRENVFVNRKFYHSINVQIVCDANLKIMSINHRYPGSCHDSYVWKNSRVRDVMRTNYLNGLENVFILGDSGYPTQPWLLTPMRNPLPDSPEARYNNSLVHVRNAVERCIGVLKGRFRCLLKDRTLHYAPYNASNIILACAVLHNITLHYNGDNDEIVREEIDNLPPIFGGPDEFQREGQTARRNYVQRYFN